MPYPDTRHRLIHLLKQLGAAALYALLAKIVLTFFSANGVVSIVWPSSGLALAMLLIGGKRYFWGVFLGAFLANAMTGITLMTAAAIATGNTLEAFIGVWLLTRNNKFDTALQSLRSYLLLVAAGSIGSIIAALNGATTLLLAGFLTSETYLTNLAHWWMGDVLGVILITPLILICWRTKNDWRGTKQLAEAALLLGLTFLVGQVILVGWFHDNLGNWAGNLTRGAWMFLLVTWVALRLGSRGVVIAVLMMAVQALWGAHHGVGYFANDIAKTQLVNYWFYMFVLSVNGMVLATFLAERKQSENTLRRSETKFSTLYDSTSDAVLLLDEKGFLDCNKAALALVGYTTKEELCSKHPADLSPPEQPCGTNSLLLANRHIATAMEKGSLHFEWACKRADTGKVFLSDVLLSAMELDGKPALQVVVRDISERKATEQRLRDLSVHMLEVREEEKARIAREIHDEFGGTLAALKMDAYWLSRKLPANEETAVHIERIKSMSQRIDSAVSTTRRVITDLRPSILDDFGLLPALEWQAEEFHKRTGIECRVNCIEDEANLDKHRSITLFRILQETLNNVSRHSGASKVEIKFHHGANEVILIVSDNGCGIPENNLATSISYGMLGMAERVGQLGGKIIFNSPQEGGFIVAVTLPLLAGKESIQ